MHIWEGSLRPLSRKWSSWHEKIWTWKIICLGWRDSFSRCLASQVCPSISLKASKVHIWLLLSSYLSKASSDRPDHKSDKGKYKMHLSPKTNWNTLWPTWLLNRGNYQLFTVRLFAIVDQNIGLSNCIASKYDRTLGVNSNNINTGEKRFVSSVPMLYIVPMSRLKE